MREDTQRAYGHGPCSQLLECENFQKYISVSTNHDSEADCRPEGGGIDIFVAHTVWQLKLLIECKFFR